MPAFGTVGVRGLMTKVLTDGLWMVVMIRTS